MCFFMGEHTCWMQDCSHIILLQSMNSYVACATYTPRCCRSWRRRSCLIRKYWQVSAGEAVTPGYALQVVYVFLKRAPGLTCQIFTRMTRVQAFSQRTPIPWIAISANLAHHKAGFQTNELFSCPLTLFLLPWLRTPSPKNLMGHLSCLKQTLDGQVLLGQYTRLSCKVTFTEQQWMSFWKKQSKKRVRRNEGRKYAFWRQNHLKELGLYFCYIHKESNGEREETPCGSTERNGEIT